MILLGSSKVAELTHTGISHRSLSKAETAVVRNDIVPLLLSIDDEDFYFKFHERDMSNGEQESLEKFVLTVLPPSIWHEFEDHCLVNEMDPIKEIRELIISSYVRTILLNLRRKAKTQE